MKFGKIVAILVLLSLIGIIMYSLYARKKIADKHMITRGNIIECEFLPRSGGRTGLKYRYSINSEIFNSSSTRIEISEKTCDSFFVGRSFPILYNPDDKKLSTILLTPSDFKAYGLFFPDSLKWILKHVDKQYQ
jgi:hypothetical protein